LTTATPCAFNHVGAARQITPDGRITAQTTSLAHFVPEVFGNVNISRSCRTLSKLVDAALNSREEPLLLFSVGLAQ
jgi:hypothetical protein